MIGSALCVLCDVFLLTCNVVHSHQLYPITTGTTVQVGIHPSKVVINKLKLDKDRKELLQRKAREDRVGKSRGADVNMAGVD